MRNTIDKKILRYRLSFVAFTVPCDFYGHNSLILEKSLCTVR